LNETRAFFAIFHIFHFWKTEAHKVLENKGRKRAVFLPEKKCLTRWPELSHGRAKQLRNHDTGGTIQKNPYAPGVSSGV